MNQLLLAVVMFLGLIMIPFGLPGTWIIAAAALGYQLLVPGTISMFTIVVVFGLAVIGEVLEFTLSAKYTRKYGGSRRASWGAIIGGMIGAFVGVAFRCRSSGRCWGRSPARSWARSSASSRAAVKGGRPRARRPARWSAVRSRPP